jgi:putative N6-adenine-specific DNA methylase
MQKNKFHLVAQTFMGLEDILGAELKSLGASGIKKLSRAVSFQGDLKTMYQANLWLRTATRVLKRIHQFSAKNEDELYQGITGVNWQEYMDVEATLAVNSVVKSKIFTHSKYAALKTKDAIVDQFRARFGIRPSVNVENPACRVHLFIYEDQCTVLLDSSGESLHRRGYRQEGHQAPLNEVSAAGLVLLSGWDKKTPLVDPMCGSGTIAIEAALLANNIAPGMYRREFGFMHWKDYDEALWDSVYDKALSAAAYTDTPVGGSDISDKAIKVATDNLGRTTLSKAVTLTQCSFQDLALPADKGMIIMNPPYDERIKVASIRELYKMIGDTLKKNCQGYTAWVLSGSKEGLKAIGLRPDKKVRIYNGALECGYNQYKIY